MTCRSHPVSEWLALNEEGQSYSQIGKKYGVTRNTVAGAIMRAKNPDYCREYAILKERYDSAISWSNELETRRAKYTHLLKDGSLPPRKQAIVSLFLQGLSIRMIAKENGISHKGVHWHLYSLGIKGVSRHQRRQTVDDLLRERAA